MRTRTRTFIHRRSNGVSSIRRMDYKSTWKETSRAVKQRDGNKCKVCGSSKDLETHHIIPLSKGGADSKANLITLCLNCHDKRHRKSKRR